MKKNQTVMILALLTVAGTAAASPRESRNAPSPLDVPPDPASTQFSLSFTGADAGGGYSATRIRFNGTMTAVAAGTYAFDTIVVIQPPDGAGIAYRLSNNYNEYVSEVFDTNFSLGRTVAPAGAWNFILTDDFQDGAGGPESTITGMTVTLDDEPFPAPTATDLGTLADGVTVTHEAAVDAASVVWFKFTNAACTGPNYRNLTISTSSDDPAADSEIGVYTPSGLLIANNDDFGALTSQLSFGSGGEDGDLPAGLHYLAVGTFNTVFGDTDFDVVTNGDAAVFTVTVLQSVNAPVPGTWSELVDGGGDAGQTVGSVQSVTGVGALPRIVGTLTPGDVDVFQINICDVASFVASTQNTLPETDTQLFLFTTTGVGLAFNDDNTLGAGGTWSQIDGATGFIPADGNYFLAISRYDVDPVDAGGQALWLDTPYASQRQPDGPGAASPFASWDGANGEDGSYQIDLVGACHVVGGGFICGPADIGGTGGQPGADGRLDNNDFVVFIDYFFSQNPIADMGRTGGAQGSDGVWDNNDFVVFIDYFFNAPATCR